MSRVEWLTAKVAPHGWRHFALWALVAVAGWAVIAVPVSYWGFTHDSRESVIAGHDVTVSPTTDGYATVVLGAYLPNMRYPLDGDLGVSIRVGKTTLGSYQGLIDRYALIASRPEAEIRKVKSLVADMAIENALQGALIGLAGPALWWVIGPRRRSELWHRMSHRRVAMLAVGGLLVVVAAASDPWSEHPPEARVAQDAWIPLGQYLPGSFVRGPALDVEVQNGLTTESSQRLLASALHSYEKSLDFYRDVRLDAQAAEFQLHQPGPDETVAVLVSDRHDNVGMDPVARAIADAGGATVLFDAGDDTSVGDPWEAFSLDSLDEAFSDFDERYAVPGNHDNGSFVGDYLADHDFVVLQGSPITTEDDIVLLGAPDPRSSGLGDWRTTVGVTFEEQRQNLADVACEADRAGRRVTTMLIHDANLGDEALDRGCVDLVVGGHLHTQVGPDRVVGSNGKVGLTYTTGTTGGAAYALAVGSKLRRDAEVSLITYREGKPVGLQGVRIKTTGKVVVEDYVDLEELIRDERAR